MFLKASSDHQSAKMKSYWSNMVRGHKSKKMKYYMTILIAICKDNYQRLLRRRPFCFLRTLVARRVLN